MNLVGERVADRTATGLPQFSYMLPGHRKLERDRYRFAIKRNFWQISAFEHTWLPVAISKTLSAKRGTN